jgi:hypothetical protein
MHHHVLGKQTILLLMATHHGYPGGRYRWQLGNGFMTRFGNAA